MERQSYRGGRTVVPPSLSVVQQAWNVFLNIVFYTVFMLCRWRKWSNGEPRVTLSLTEPIWSISFLIHNLFIFESSNFLFLCFSLPPPRLPPPSLPPSLPSFLSLFRVLASGRNTLGQAPLSALGETCLPLECGPITTRFSEPAPVSAAASSCAVEGSGRELCAEARGLWVQILSLLINSYICFTLIF